MKKDPYAPYRGQTEPLTQWRSVDAKAEEPSLQQAVDPEFPTGLTTPGGYNRRDALKIAGASIALGSMTACVRRPEEEILPFVRAPEAVIPGVRLMYATTMPRSEGAVGLLVESHEGRPTKIEGNPNHPASLGSADVWAQSEVLKMYDPDRARMPRQGGQNSTWQAWDGFAQDHFQKVLSTRGQGLAFLLQDDVGPTSGRVLKDGLTRLPEAKVYRYDPLAPDESLMGAQLAFGPGSRVSFDLAKTNVIFGLDSNFLMEGPDHLRLAKGFGQKRAPRSNTEAPSMNRLYIAEGVYSPTGANADHRLRISSAGALDLLKAVARALAASHGVALGELAGAVQGAGSEAQSKFVAGLAKDLAAAQGACAILVGERQPAAVHALAYALNVALGAVRTGAMTVLSSGDTTPRVSHTQSLTALTDALRAGQVQTLVIFEANPVYTAPGALKFADALGKATVIHAGVLPDETALKATWHLPLAHFLESWGDARAFNGTASVVQPLILPLFGSRAGTTLLAQMVGAPEHSDRKLVEETWVGGGKPVADAKMWRRALHEGVIQNTTYAAAAATPANAAIVAAVGQVKATAPSKDALEVVALHGNVQDGRLANVSWLQELPDSMTKLCWDNAFIVSPALAKELGIESGVQKNRYVADMVELSVGDRKVTGPVFVLPGMAPHTVAVHLGYGKTWGGVAGNVGFDVFPLLQDTRGVVEGVKLTRTGKTHDLCSTQDHFSVPADPLKMMTFAQMSAAQGPLRSLGLGQRPLFRSGSSTEYAKEGRAIAAEGAIVESLLAKKDTGTRPSRPIQLHSEVVYEGQQWGMAIDLSACIGCSACMVACVAENNIPAVGREQVMLGRELHWIRVDRYFVGDVDAPRAVHQPVPCMHCENAPCEPVCPVSATVHDEEGLNTMAYNRCIGTRYCNNNCPFKVRRFNYLDFSGSGDFHVEEKAAERWKTLKLQRNPDVTVRYRGVMEKCTYCTQRIEEAKQAAKHKGNDRKKLPDGAVVPACAQTCPTEAITFGNINDPTSRVAKLKLSDRNYEMLQELNVRPRTTYLARIFNENEELS